MKRSVCGNKKDLKEAAKSRASVERFKAAVDQQLLHTLLQ